MKKDAEAPAAYRDRLAYFLAKSDLMDTICAHVANGGTLISICATWDLVYGHVTQWINGDEARRKLYAAAIVDRGEWEKERILHELRQIGVVDIRKVFNDDFTIKNPSEWPDDVAAAIAGMEVADLMEGSGDARTKVGELRKIKLHPKLDALEALGKQLGMFVQRHDVKVSKSLEEVLEEANAEPEKGDEQKI